MEQKPVTVPNEKTSTMFMIRAQITSTNWVSNLHTCAESPSMLAEIEMSPATSQETVKPYDGQNTLQSGRWLDDSERKPVTG